jgi:hypothetical protein
MNQISIDLLNILIDLYVKILIKISVDALIQTNKMKINK